MYGAAIPEDAEAMVSKVESKQPRNNQYRVVVALGVGVLIGALGTALLTPAPTPAPRAGQILAAMEGDDLLECKNQLKYAEKQAGSCCMQLMTCIEKT